MTVTAGQRVECTFVNVLRGSPSVTITKVAPPLAIHGSTLDYELTVTNTGTIAFAAADVEVTDDRCDEPPAITAQADGDGAPDATPGTLEPGDVWTYACTRTTALPDPDGCAIEEVTNTGRVTVPGADDSRRHGDAAALPAAAPARHRDPEAGPGDRGGRDDAGLHALRDQHRRGGVRGRGRDGQRIRPATPAQADRPLRRLRGARPVAGQLLDPEDVWVYRCTNATPAPGAGLRAVRRHQHGHGRRDEPAPPGRRQRLRRHAADLPARPAADAAGPAGSRRSTPRATSRIRGRPRRRPTRARPASRT